MRLLVCRLPLIALTVIAYALLVGVLPAAAAQPVGQGVARLAELTPAQLRQATIPATRADMLRTINASPKLRQAVVAAAAALHLDSTKLLAPGGPGSGQPMIRSRAVTYEPPPCDWDKGVALDINHPLAATGWPPSEWAALLLQDVALSGGTSLNGFLPTLPDLQAVSQALSPLNGIVTFYGVSGRPSLAVQLHPTKVALYAADINLVGSAPDSFTVKGYSDRAGGAQPLVGFTVLGNVLEIIVKVDEVPTSVNQLYEVDVEATGPEPIWSIGTVTARRL